MTSNSSDFIKIYPNTPDAQINLWLSERVFNKVSEGSHKAGSDTGRSFLALAMLDPETDDYQKRGMITAMAPGLIDRAKKIVYAHMQAEADARNLVRNKTLAVSQNVIPMNSMSSALAPQAEKIMLAAVDRWNDLPFSQQVLLFALTEMGPGPHKDFEVAKWFHDRGMTNLEIIPVLNKLKDSKLASRVDRGSFQAASFVYDKLQNVKRQDRRSA